MIFLVISFSYFSGIFVCLFLGFGGLGFEGTYYKVSVVKGLSEYWNFQLNSGGLSLFFDSGTPGFKK